MQLIDAEIKILAMNQIVVTTQDVSARLQISITHASKVLQRLAIAGKLIRLKRGKWLTNSNSDPLLLPEYLTSPFPSYISLQSALYYHGLLSQIPSTIYAISLARTQLISSPIATISIHRVSPEFFFGFTLNNEVKIASAEKALVDYYYLHHVRSNLFKSLPEIESLENINSKEMSYIVSRIPSKRIQSQVKNQLAKLGLIL